MNRKRTDPIGGVGRTRCQPLAQSGRLREIRSAVGSQRRALQLIGTPEGQHGLNGGAGGHRQFHFVAMEQYIDRQFMRLSVICDDR